MDYKATIECGKCHQKEILVTDNINKEQEGVFFKTKKSTDSFETNLFVCKKCNVQAGVHINMTDEDNKKIFMK